MSGPERSQEPVDLLLFTVGEQVFAADATEVLRIDRRDSAPAAKALGELKLGLRALVVQGPQGESRIPVDDVKGIHNAAVADLRRRPPSLRAHPCAIGFWISGDSPVVLIDLKLALNA